TLLELSKAIASHHNLSNLFNDLTVLLHQLFNFHNLGVVLHDQSRNVLRLHILETTEPAIHALPDEVPIEGSISGWVWQNQRPFVSADIQNETRFSTIKMMRDYPVKSVCYMPLTTARRRLGVLIIWSNKAGAYDQLDLEFAQVVAAQIAVAMENAFNF